MIKIELNAEDCAVKTKEVTSTRTGEILHFREQKALFIMVVFIQSNL